MVVLKSLKKNMEMLNDVGKYGVVSVQAWGGGGQAGIHSIETWSVTFWTAVSPSPYFSVVRKARKPLSPSFTPVNSAEAMEKYRPKSIMGYPFGVGNIACWYLDRLYLHATVYA